MVAVGTTIKNVRASEMSIHWSMSSETSTAKNEFRNWCTPETIAAFPCSSIHEYFL
jgi:hypothetical protein